MTDKHNEIDIVLANLGLSMESVFVPWSKSRSYKPDAKLSDYSLNWNVTIRKNGKAILTTPYTAGIGHCQTKLSSFHHKPTIFEENCIVAECEGKYTCEGKLFDSKPKFHDVMASIVLDSDAIDYGNFEDWANNNGCDTDSRKAEATYKSCLEHALALRLAVGDQGLQQLREVFQDY